MVDLVEMSADFPVILKSRVDIAPCNIVLMLILLFELLGVRLLWLHRKILITIHSNPPQAFLA